MQRRILRQGLSLGHHSSKHSPHARVKRAEDTPLHDAAESLQDKGTQAVSACSCEHMGSANARGSAHLRTKSSSSRRYLRRGGVQRGHRCPLCWLARRRPTWRTPEGSSRLARSDERTCTHKDASTCMLHPLEEKASEPLTKMGWHAGGGEGGGPEGSCPVQYRAPRACEGGKGRER